MAWLVANAVRSHHHDSLESCSTRSRSSSSLVVRAGSAPAGSIALHFHRLDHTPLLTAYRRFFPYYDQ